MRLAVVSPFVDRRHGTERALAELLERLARVQHCEIHLYAQRAEDLSFVEPASARSGKSGVIVWHKVPYVPGPQLLQFSCWVLLNSLQRFWDQRVRGLRFDLILSPGINCLDVDVMIVHALFSRLRELGSENESPVSRSNLLRRLHRRAYYAFLSGLERRLYSNPKVTLATVSRRMASLLSERFHRSGVTVIPNGVDITQFSPSMRLTLRAQARARRNFHEGDFLLLLIGNDWRTKGLETLVRAVGVLRDRPIQLLAVGSEPPEPFRRLAGELGILPRCHFEKPRPDVLDLYAAADLYVSPSLEDSFGLPVAEAMACGLPVITSSLAGVSELIQPSVDGFVLQNPQDSHELARLLDELLRDTAQRERVGEAAARAAQEWSWDRNASSVYELLKQALQ